MNKLTTTYSLVLGKQIQPKQYEFVVRPLDGDDWLKRPDFVYKKGIFDFSGSISKIYTLNNDGEKDPLSEIIFWFESGCFWYGHVLYNGKRARATLDGFLTETSQQPVTLSLTIDDKLFDKVYKERGLCIVEDSFAAARRSKFFQTESLNAYHYHGFLVKQPLKKCK